MDLDDDVAELETFEQEVQCADIQGLLKFYAKSDFEMKLRGIATILRRRGVPAEIVAQVVATGLSQRTHFERIQPGELTLMSFSRSAGILFPQASADPLLQILSPLIEQIAAERDAADTGKILRAIDAEFEAPIDGLIALTPSELEGAKNNLVKATKSYGENRPEESALFTRMAWECCVNYALTKLPEAKGLHSLSSKTKYVLEQIGLREKSKLINELKNLYEGSFLHVLEGKEKITQQDLPFYIALTTGFVNLTARRLTTKKT